MRSRRDVWRWCFCAFAASAGMLLGQTSETARVLDGAGGWVTSAVWSNLSAVCQPGPAGLTTNAAYVNWSGFLQSFLMFPGRDADADGRADENDLDDDNDGLADAVEIAGSAFNPPTPTDVLQPDSDHDGMSDGAEAGAGTDPQNPGGLLRIFGIEPAASGVAVTWSARSGYRYELLSGASVDALASSPSVVTQVTAAGGVGLWQAGEASATNSFAPTNSFYRVRVSGRP